MHRSLLPAILPVHNPYMPRHTKLHMGKVSQQGTGTSDIHPDCPSHIRTANFHRSPPHRPRWRCIRATICLHISHQNNKPHKWGDDMPFLRRLGCVHSSVSDLCVPEDRRHQPPSPSSYAIGCTRPCRVCSDPDSKSLQSIRTPVGAAPAAQYIRMSPDPIVPPLQAGCVPSARKRTVQTTQARHRHRVFHSKCPAHKRTTNSQISPPHA
jgi:hypothetical protein